MDQSRMVDGSPDGNGLADRARYGADLAAGYCHMAYPWSRILAIGSFSKTAIHTGPARLVMCCPDDHLV